MVEVPGMEEIGKMAELVAVMGYYTRGDLVDASVAERDLLYNLLLSRERARARITRKLSDSRASPQESEPEKQRDFEEVDISGAMNAGPPLEWIGEILRPRPKAAGLFSAVLRSCA